MSVSLYFADWIGFLAAVLTTLAFIPQAVMVRRTSDTRSISLGMYSLFVIGIFLWLVYGIAVNSYPLIAANIVTFFMAAYILCRKLINVRTGRDA